MIRLRGVGCLLPGTRFGAGRLGSDRLVSGRPASGRLAFGPVDLDIPVDRSVAILGEPPEARTLLLRLLGGRIRADAGTVSGRPRLSPIINDEKLLHPAMTGLANLRFLARLYGVDRDVLVRAVDAFCGLGPLLTERVRDLDGGARRTLEASITILLPFETYLLDDAQQLPAAILGQCREAARARNAGFIFASGVPRAPRQHADAAVVLDGCELTFMPDPHRAAERAERQAA